MNIFLKTPEVWLTLVGCFLLVYEAVAKVSSRRIGTLALLTVVVLTVTTSLMDSQSHELWNKLYVWDASAQYFKVFFMVVGGVVLWIAMLSEQKLEGGRGEFYPLILFALAGMSLLASVQDLMLLFVALELITITFYILVAYQRSNPVALEAGVKYLIMGALASTFLVMGTAYLFGVTGSTQFDSIGMAIRMQEVRVELVFGLALVLIGLLFKVASVPFHVWAPDVYQGAPLPVTAFLAVGSKAAGFVLLLRVLNGPFGEEEVTVYWVPALMTLAGLSMILGNLAAIPQRNVQRMLAYSGIGHAGFLMAGLATHSRIGHASVYVYLTTYLISALTAFVVVAVVGRSGPAEQVSHFAGLSKRSPLLAASLAMALVSMAGIPPLIGFIGKFTIFLSLWQAGYYLLFGIGVFCAVAGLYYYLGLVREMYWSSPTQSDPVEVDRPTRYLLVVMIGLMLVIGFWSQPLLYLAQRVLVP